jgi:hypothetical protein
VFAQFDSARRRNPPRRKALNDGAEKEQGAPMKANFFYTLACDDGELLLASTAEIPDFPALCDEAVAEVGRSLYAVAAYLKEHHRLRRIQAERYYNLDTGSEVAPDET